MLVCNNADNTIRWKPGERLHHLFEQCCDRVGHDHLAVITEEGAYTFRKLDERANQTARFLLDQGLKPGDRIGLLVDKSIHAYVGLLAILKIDAAYVPLDAGFPAERTGFILEDAAVRAIVSVSRFRTKLAEFKVQQLFIDTTQEKIAREATSRLSNKAKPESKDQLFYVIYTSGTTGKPKGVAINHSGICNFVKVAGEVYGIRPTDRCYQGMTLAFDFHVEDLWVPLLVGATLVAGKSETSLFGNDLHAFLLERKVNYFPCVPTLWATIEEDLPDVRIVLLSGEAVPHHLVVRWHRPGRTILNAYGPTECSVSSTLRKLLPESPVTIGRPLPTYMVVILDEHKDEVVAEGHIGEIGVAGIALAVGYLNREDLTRQKFIPDFLDLPNNPSKRIYRTGDYGRLREDGDLEFLGRIDTQVKVRGYRVELGEIEAVLSQLPSVAQAVVQPHEEEPGAAELVAYYTCKQGVDELSPREISEALRKRLPCYMVPAFFEKLPLIPMTSNNKADRKSLPAPKGQRLSQSNGTFVAPSTTTERTLADALAHVMKIERASVGHHFFHDLGAHSLLMARFGAEIRKRLHISSVSMQDIYLNPTIEKLARHIDTLPAEVASKPESRREPLLKPSNFAYYGCGALQLSWGLAWAALVLWVLVQSIIWTYAAMPDLGATYLRVVGLAAALMLLSCVIPLAAKWLVIGRWKPEVFPVWSLRYFRFWAIKSLIRSAPLARFDGPLYNLYLRLLGAKIGANAVIHARVLPVCTDLLSIGANTIVRRDALLASYKAEANRIYSGPIQVGSNVFIGEASYVDINTVMEDSTQLGHSSALYAGQRVPRGKRYHGTPARETTANYCVVEPRICTSLRRWTYALVLLVLGFALLPMPVLVLYWLLPNFYDFSHGTQLLNGVTAQLLLLIAGKAVAMSAALFVGLFILGLLGIGLVPRLFNLFLKPGKTYVNYGVHYFLQQTIARMSNSAFFNRVFGDSCGIVHYVRWLGYRLNKIVQTGSNFGEEQYHDNPFLVDIGSGTMISDGLMMSSTVMSHSAFRLGVTKIGADNYLGNYVRYPTGGRTGDNCLLGTMVLVPIEGPIRENIGLLGSPCFAIPRAVSRDRRMAEAMDEATKRQRLRAKNVYNFVTAVLYLSKTWFSFSVLAVAVVVTLPLYPRFGLPLLFALGAFAFFFGVFWAWFVERCSLGFKRLSPQIALVLDKYYWFHERHWHLFGLTDIARFFSGTPFKNIFSRLEGVRMGEKVFDDGVRWTEYSLIEIGDYANLNFNSTIWPHSLEEGVFKSDYIRIGAGCTLHSASLTHYGVTMGEQVVLAPASYLMKGEILEPHMRWQGNPAKAIEGVIVMNPINMQKPQFSQSLTNRLLSAQASHAAAYERGIDNLVRGLVDLLPEPNTMWTLGDRVKWLRLAAGIFDFGYKAGDGTNREISIVLDSDRKPLGTEIDATVPLTEWQLRRLKQIRARMKESSKCRSPGPEAAARRVPKLKTPKWSRRFKPADTRSIGSR